MTQQMQDAISKLESADTGLTNASTADDTAQQKLDAATAAKKTTATDKSAAVEVERGALNGLLGLVQDALAALPPTPVPPEAGQ